MQYVYSNFWVYAFHVLDAQLLIYMIQSKLESIYFNVHIFKFLSICVSCARCSILNVCISIQIWIYVSQCNRNTQILNICISCARCSILYTCISIQIWIYVFQCMYPHIYVYIYIFSNLIYVLQSKFVYLHFNPNLNMCIWIQIWKYVFQCMYAHIYVHIYILQKMFYILPVKTHCNTLQHTATRCNTLQHICRRCFTSQRENTQKMCCTHKYESIYSNLRIYIYSNLYI